MSNSPETAATAEIIPFPINRRAPLPAVAADDDGGPDVFPAMNCAVSDDIADCVPFLRLAASLCANDHVQLKKIVAHHLACAKDGDGTLSGILSGLDQAYEYLDSLAEIVETARLRIRETVAYVRDAG
jgi:hypothetical protein